jgi:hypothetical protein
MNTVNSAATMCHEEGPVREQLAIRNGGDKTDNKLMAVKRKFDWRECDNRLLRKMGIAAV